MRILRCRDAGFNCDAIVREISEEEVVKTATRHAQEVHRILLSEQNVREIRERIKDE